MKIHGLRHHPLYSRWCDMKQRCYNKNRKDYPRYGGKGTKICDEWLNDFQSFYTWALKNGWEENLSIDRIDNKGNYEPSNCRWSTDIEQANNQSSNTLIDYNGKTQTTAELAREYNINYKTFHTRLARGWTIDEILTIPVRERL